MATVHTTLSDGVLIDFSHDEVNHIVTAEDTAATVLGVVGAAFQFVAPPLGNILGLAAAAIAGTIAIHKIEFQNADHGAGVEVTLPWWAVVFNLWGALIINPLSQSRQVGPFHFFTTSLDERDNAIANLGFVSEEIACYVFPAQATGTIPLHRLVHGNDHFFTTSDAERDNAISQFGYQSEGEACFVFPMQAPGTQPLHRLRSTVTGEHFYTASDAERDNAIANLSYISEGEACFVFTADPSGVTPFYRLRP